MYGIIKGTLATIALYAVIIGPAEINRYLLGLFEIFVSLNLQHAQIDFWRYYNSVHDVTNFVGC